MSFWQSLLKRLRRPTLPVVMSQTDGEGGPESPVFRLPIIPSPGSPIRDEWWAGPVTYEQRTGVKHRNPLNVKAPTADYWRGQVGRDSRGHAMFGDPADGVRAAAVLLRTYWNKYDLRTVSAILSRWAPTSDTIGSLPGAAANSPTEYAAFVRKRTGIGPFEPLKLFSGDKVRNRLELSLLIKAMAEYEIGGGFLILDDVVQRGIDRVG